jgi:1,4-dihydroxy-6-naphthoate synthase
MTLGFSPCPNDTFIFDAMIHGKIDTEGLVFEPIMEDVETLNLMALRQELDITKLSYHLAAHVLENYIVLDAGSALGNNCGPLLIGKKVLSNEEIKKAIIAIPGKYTTANLLFSLAFPEVGEKRTMVFNEIEKAVLSGEVDAGVIIHENRFTYAQKGLKKIIDLGEYWESTSHSPIPLGGILVNRRLPLDVQHKVNRVLRKSVEYAFKNPKSSYSFIKAHAQEMEESVMYQHIDLYVNSYSLDLGTVGKNAIKQLFEKATQNGIINPINFNIFLN